MIPTDQEIARIEANVEKALGRKLTAEECKYLRLSFPAAPPQKDEPKSGPSLVPRKDPLDSLLE